MLPKIVVERFATLALEQCVKVHISAIPLRKAGAISLAQGPHARLAALVANFAALVAATMIEAHPRTLPSHRRSPL